MPLFQRWGLAHLLDQGLSKDFSLHALAERIATGLLCKSLLGSSPNVMLLQSIRMHPRGPLQASPLAGLHSQVYLKHPVL